MLSNHNLINLFDYQWARDNPALHTEQWFYYLHDRMEKTPEELLAIREYKLELLNEAPHPYQYDAAALANLPNEIAGMETYLTSAGIEFTCYFHF